MYAKAGLEKPVRGVTGFWSADPDHRLHHLGRQGAGRDEPRWDNTPADPPPPIATDSHQPRSKEHDMSSTPPPPPPLPPSSRWRWLQRRRQPTLAEPVDQLLEEGRPRELRQLRGPGPTGGVLVVLPRRRSCVSIVFNILTAIASFFLICSLIYALGRADPGHRRRHPPAARHRQERLVAADRADPVRRIHRADRVHRDRRHGNPTVGRVTEYA